MINRDCTSLTLHPNPNKQRDKRTLRQLGIYDTADFEVRQEKEPQTNDRLLSVLSHAEHARNVEIADLRQRITQLLPAMTEQDKAQLFRALGSDPHQIRSVALAVARQEVAEEARRFSPARHVPTVTTTGSDISYKEVAELYKLVEMMKDKVLSMDSSGGIIFAEGITIKDLASFTGAVNNLYGTFMKSKDQAKLHEDINKITEALKQAMKEMPQEYVNRFMEILTSFDN